MDILAFLANHPEPVIRWKTIINLMGNEPTSPEVQRAKVEFASSQIIQRLLSDRNGDGLIPYHPYDKWFGAHWVLSLLADFSFPKGNEALKPLLNQSYCWLLSKEHEKNIRMINGRVRRCASQEGNCIYYSLVLGLADERTEELANRLLKWQWDDGGWNCDKRSEASTSSFNETLIPLRGLTWYAKTSGDPKIEKAVSRAAEVFLKRHLFKRMRDENVIDRNFMAHWE
jgi:hypothetical protein